ncbi:hypothetical protein CGRA01v4_12715 [Colletotrichum graminicola]|uniref:Uncharacterized protein n=1 Tax=Colletotrichum graminicola (strain M1.001 / M2 / FGSC 10212) TaxID=645133 RepID=E3QI73_COLGM|nr:uncharacterized protein GLRG_05832 [Colletotrichum graminicola M1.001]EFQ30688.1 hypothetical protein GLRG_05832 [Colletotrichum graminicola M1.001]WDK21425.1 hypothetical protein CGRA01v4_12715 [Colletotrichum graminicola]
MKTTWFGLLLLQAMSLALAAAIERPNEEAEKEAARILKKPFEPLHPATGKMTVAPFHETDNTVAGKI